MIRSGLPKFVFRSTIRRHLSRTSSSNVIHTRVFSNLAIWQSLSGEKQMVKGSTDLITNPTISINSDTLYTSAFVSDLIRKMYCFKLSKLNEILSDKKMFSKTKMTEALEMNYMIIFKNNMTKRDYEYCKSVEESYYEDLMSRLK